MLKVGITGQSGFIGSHLFNTLNLFNDKFEPQPFDDNVFDKPEVLADWVSKCDVIVHLAGINRDIDKDKLYSENVRLVQKLIFALENTNKKPHILFSSSTQRELNNHYGLSKLEGAKLFRKWAENNYAKFSELIIPNVFGPFSKPFYNSVVATFCYQLTHNDIPKIEVDSKLKLVYVGDLVKNIIQIIEISNLKSSGNFFNEQIVINHSKEISVSELLDLLKLFKTIYLENGVIPDLADNFYKNLFNTFLCYIEHKSFFPYQLKMNSDNRGIFVEVIKSNSSGQMSFASSNEGITRGNHFHTRKAERFAVIHGRALIEIRRIGTDEIMSFELDGSEPSFVDIPVWYTHNIKNIGKGSLLIIFWINEFFNPEDSDTFFENVRK